MQKQDYLLAGIHAAARIIASGKPGCMSLNFEALSALFKVGRIGSCRCWCSVYAAFVLSVII